MFVCLFCAQDIFGCVCGLLNNKVNKKNAFHFELPPWNRVSCVHVIRLLYIFFHSFFLSFFISLSSMRSRPWYYCIIVIVVRAQSQPNNGINNSIQFVLDWKTAKLTEHGDRTNGKNCHFCGKCMGLLMSFCGDFRIVWNGWVTVSLTEWKKNCLKISGNILLLIRDYLSALVLFLLEKKVWHFFQTIKNSILLDLLLWILWKDWLWMRFVTIDYIRSCKIQIFTWNECTLHNVLNSANTI